MDKRFLNGTVSRQWQETLPRQGYWYFKCNSCGFSAIGMNVIINHLDEKHPETKKDTV